MRFNGNNDEYLPRCSRHTHIQRMKCKHYRAPPYRYCISVSVSSSIFCLDSEHSQTELRVFLWSHISCLIRFTINCFLFVYNFCYCFFAALKCCRLYAGRRFVTSLSWWWAVYMCEVELRWWCEDHWYINALRSWDGMDGCWASNAVITIVSFNDFSPPPFSFANERDEVNYVARWKTLKFQVNNAP